MTCRICGSSNIKMIYDDKIRNGGLGYYTKDNVSVYQCEACKVIWHENTLSDIGEYYESTEYRDSLEGGSEETRFYQLHDKETFQKIQYTGTSVFRNKIVADIGCGCGAFLDFISGVAELVIAVEPSETYRKIMDGKRYHTYAYTEEVLSDFRDKVDIVTSFDVIEHVEDPETFLRNICKLLKTGGKAIIGTPTDAPIMRQLLGRIYEKKLLFSTQHLWIFSGNSLEILADKCGCSGKEVKYFQRYGIDNLMGWLRDKEPNSEIKMAEDMDELNTMWKSWAAEKELGDYIVLYLEK